MIRINNEDILTQTESAAKAIKAGIGALPEEKFLRKSFPVLAERAKRTYPYQVKIPKSVKEMADGDFEPAQIITISEPIIGPYGPMWFGDATGGIALRCGYKNGDSRYINDVTLGDANIHGIMGGATGQGKSVTLNSILYGVCYEYAPWEVKLTLSDAKVVEFKDIAVNNPMPHIENVAATGDVDYLLSVLMDKENEMNVTQSVFTKAGEVFGSSVKNIAEFRKVTGLCLPQNLLVFDEFQTMFKMAKKLAPMVAASIDSFARLGRAMGYHLFLASQELGTDIPKATLNNITVRAALGCQPSVSNMILGNDEAKMYLGRKGHLIFNLSSQNEDATENSLVRVPLILGETAEIFKATDEKASKLGFQRKMNFYDEQAYKREAEYVKWVNSLPNGNVIYLGEPSFVDHDPISAVRLSLQHEDSENICIFSGKKDNQIRFTKMLMTNITRMSASNLVLCLDSTFTNNANVESLNPTHFYTDRTYENNTMINIARSLIYRKQLCIEADTLVFNNSSYSDVTNSVFYSLFEHDCKYDTITNRRRFYNIYSLLQTDVQIKQGLGLLSKTGQQLEEEIRHLAKTCIESYEIYNAADTRLTLDRMPPVFVWIFGLDRLIGIGRDPITRHMNDLKKLLQDAYLANMRFIVTVSSMEELTPLSSTFCWFLLESLSTSDTQKIKCSEFYPEQLGSGLAVLYSPLEAENKCKKFKKMILDGELAPL